MDEKDSSVTRPLELYRELFTKAKMDCYRQVKQRHFPKGIYNVYMFVLKPLEKDCSESKTEKNDNIYPQSDVKYDSVQVNIDVNVYHSQNST